MEGVNTLFLRRIMGYHWINFITNDRVLHELGMTQVSCMIRTRRNMATWLGSQYIIRITERAVQSEEDLERDRM